MYPKTISSKNAGQTKAQLSAGQTLVEYILLLSLVMGVVVIFGKGMDKGIAPLLSNQLDDFRSKASRGGEDAYQDYYKGGAQIKHRIVPP